MNETIDWDWVCDVRYKWKWIHPCSQWQLEHGHRSTSQCILALSCRVSTQCKHTWNKCTTKNETNMIVTGLATLTTAVQHCNHWHISSGRGHHGNDHSHSLSNILRWNIEIDRQQWHFCVFIKPSGYNITTLRDPFNKKSNPKYFW